MVETQGLEPWTPALQRRCSSQLSYCPIILILFSEKLNQFNDRISYPVSLIYFSIFKFNHDIAAPLSTVDPCHPIVLNLTTAIQEKLMSIQNFFIGLMITAYGIISLQYNYRYTNLFSRSMFIEKWFGSMFTFLKLTSILASIIGLAVMFSLGDDLANFILLPFQKLFGI